MIKHMPGDENESDIFMKNATGPYFKKHICKFVGVDEYMDEE